MAMTIPLSTPEAYHPGVQPLQRIGSSQASVTDPDSGAQGPFVGE